LLDLDVRFEGDGNDVLETVLEHVSDGEGVGETTSQRDSSKLVGSVSDLADQSFGVKVEDVGSEDSTIIVDVEDFHTESEGLYVQLGKDSSFGVTDLLTLFQDLVFLGDFDLTLLNLGGDVKGVEERDLRGIHTSGAGGNGDINGGDGTDLSGGGDLVRFNDGLKVEDGGIREDETDFTLAVGEDLFDLGNLSVQRLSEFEIGIIFLGRLKSDVDGLLDDGVLTADHITDLLLSQSVSDLLNLVGGNVFKLNDEALLVVGEVLVESVHDSSLLSSLG